MKRLVPVLVLVLAIAGCSATGSVSTSQAEATPEATPEATLNATEAPAITIPKTFSKLDARSWAKVVKSPDSYLGRGYWLWACISQFDAATGADTFRADASYRKEEYFGLDGKNALFTGDESKLSDFVEGDLIYMKVADAGSFSYDTQIGGNTTVPLFLVVSISRKGSCQ